MKISHDWLKEYLGEQLPSVERIEELLTFHSFEIEGVEQVGDDTIIDVDVLPNRASDCLCHRGVARELASLLNQELEYDPLIVPVTIPETNKLEVSITDSVSCRRFGAVLMHGIEVTESPEWLQKRLLAIGQRPINNIVDATNYVMFAVGQPLHAYDASKFTPDNDVWKLGVRYARAGERITTLTSDEYELSDQVQVIVNSANDTLAGIAGIKGGTYAEVDGSTTSIILEAANFDPVVTRKASQLLRLQTDASKRFENEASRELVPCALQSVATLIKEIAGGVIVGMVDSYPTPRDIPEVAVSLKRTNALLGIQLTQSEVSQILTRIGASYTETTDGFLVRGPWERNDITIEEDVIEEIGRVHGYVHVASVVPETVALAEVNARHYYSERVRDVLIEEGFSEVITSSFRNTDIIRLRNALASDKGYLRSSLKKNMKEVLDRNLPFIDLLETSNVRVFEIGTVFTKVSDGVAEHTALTLGVRTRHGGPCSADDAILTEMLALLSARLGVEISGHVEAGICEINFTELVDMLPVPTTYDTPKRTDNVTYAPFSPYPHTSRDIALWVPSDTSVEEVEKLLWAHAGELCVRVTLFDTFSKDGRTSYAFRLVFQSDKRTLTDADVTEVMEKIYVVVKENNWEVR